MNKIKTIFTAITFFLITACSTTGLGREGSPAWHATAKPESISSFYQSKDKNELCNLWFKAVEKGISVTQIRKSISEALISKGQPSMACANPNVDRKIIDMKKTSQSYDLEVQRKQAEIRMLNNNATRALFNNNRALHCRSDFIGGYICE